MLYIVATPIGNLKDITIRAIETLKKVDLILCEDTRETIKILKNYGIEKPLLSYYREIERKRIRKIINMLMEGKEIALVCDRGTPGISDPAYLLVNEAYQHGIKVIPVPGPSALTAALSVSGLPTDKFSFYGFLPRKKGKRKKLLESLKEREETLVFFESVHRIKNFLSEICEIFGDREVIVGRELTKKFEEIRRGRIKEIIDWYQKNVVKGEFVILVKGKE